MTFSSKKSTDCSYLFTVLFDQGENSCWLSRFAWLWILPLPLGVSGGKLKRGVRKDLYSSRNQGRTGIDEVLERVGELSILFGVKINSIDPLF